MTRGSVLRLPRRLGFGAPRQAERVAVVQAEPFNAALRTVLVVPLDVATDVHAGRTTCVPVSAAETGGESPHVAVVHALQCIPAERLAPGIVGNLAPATLARVDEVLKLVLGLR